MSHLLKEQLQSILLPRKNFNVNTAIQWINNNGYDVLKIPHVTHQFIRFRQAQPDYEKYHYVTKHIGHSGIDFIIGYPRKELEGGSIKSFVKDRYNNVKDILEFPSKILHNRIIPAFGGPRNHESSRLRKFLDSGEGNQEIIKIEVGRVPVASAIQNAINFLSLGRFKKRIEDLKYDDVYHNFLIVTTKDGQKWRVEKNAVVEINKNYGENKFYDVHDVPITMGEGYTMNKLIDAFKTRTPDPWEYRADRNNCQDFVKNVLLSNHIDFGSDENKKVINPQNTRDILEHSGVIKHIHKPVTDLGGIADIVIHGNSIKK